MSINNRRRIPNSFKILVKCHCASICLFTDELIFNVFPDELAELQALVTDRMEHAYSGNVRLEVSSGVGDNWLEAH